MGNNPSCTTSKFSRDNIPEAQLNVPFPVPNACGPAGSVSLYVSCPKNGEFQASGETGSCYYDSNEPGNQINCSSGCLDGHCAIVGNGFSCKRIAYTANEIDCCVSGAKTIGNSTCNPIYSTLQKGNCNEQMKTFCSKGNNFFDRQVCQDWCKLYPEQCDSVLVGACTSSINVDREECSCIQEAIAYQKAGLDMTLPPQCVSAKCVGPRVLKTSAQQKTNCNILSCNMTENEFNINNAKIGGGLNLVQKCSIYPDGTPNPSIGDVLNDPTVLMLPETKKKILLYGGISAGFLVILLIIIIAILLIMSGNKNNK